MNLRRTASALAGILFLCGILALSDLARGENGRAAKSFPVPLLGGEIVVLPGVFPPREAENVVLPFMVANKRLFEGKVVMEIGAGSGVNSVFAAKLGAKKVVATDINKNAIASTNQNAKRFGVGSIIETRLVPKSDMSAFSAIKAGETFDVILSNPPYSLDLDAPTNNAITDRGDLGASLIRGLNDHLNPGGVAVLLYDSLFYHHLIVQFARLEGYYVKNHLPVKLTAWEAATLFDYYGGRWAKLHGLDPANFKFDWQKQLGAQPLRVKSKSNLPPLFLWNKPNQNFPGWIVIQRS
jgi:methylase of polypeptide subunit release factors